MPKRMITRDIVRELVVESLSGYPDPPVREAVAVRNPQHAERMKRTAAIEPRYRKRYIRRWGLDNPCMADEAWELMFHKAMKEKL